MERFVSTKLISSSFFYNYKCIPFHISFPPFVYVVCLFVFDVRKIQRYHCRTDETNGLLS